MQGSIEYSSYVVECVRDEKHGEKFVIVLLSKGELRWLSHRLSEEKLRDVLLDLLGSLDDQVEDAIRLAREQADSKQRGTSTV